ncbi:hypothetical protein J5N97_013925 [Dioscorea zingiberensis]|uniref:Exocyst subunit Exo70 family protein n=1 Tax=Dioscorea zingiberensis TaxID=325984 RepID=A0A9D5HJ80_9LILI|nr:hypothetical protein J5N97_013925 [Dioscorea zingiberensis]
MEENINAAQSIILKWDENTSSYAKLTPLFHDDRAEARQFLRGVAELQTAMLYFVSNEHGGVSVYRSQALASAQKLMQTAMRRLEREFYQILSSNRDQLDPESISTHSSHSSISMTSDGGGDDADEEIRAAGDFISEVEHTSALVMADLRDIADVMISVGYGKECVQIYRVIRKSIVDESLYRLGFENHAPNQIQKLEWEVLDLKIKTWVSAAKVAIKTLFYGERILCDHVFGGSESIRESCFADVTKEAALQFLGFSESVAKTKRSPEKLFRILDLYNTISDLLPDIATIFSFESTAAVRSQAITSLQKLSEIARSTLTDFEAVIQKDASKTPPSGAGIHPLTRYAMIYIVSLADYDAALTEIFSEGTNKAQSSLTDSSYEGIPSPSTTSFSSDEGIRSSVAAKLARLLLVLICKLDSKAGIYKDGAMSYLFLANNLWFIVRKVKESKLGFILGEEWEPRHAETARQYTRSYERVAWGRVAAAAVAEGIASAGEAWERMRAFNVAFEEAMRSQSECVIADEELREEVRTSIAGMIVPGYRILYDKGRETLKDSAMNLVRYAPDDVRILVADLFENAAGSGRLS